MTPEEASFKLEKAFELVLSAWEGFPREDHKILWTWLKTAEDYVKEVKEHLEGSNGKEN